MPASPSIEHLRKQAKRLAKDEKLKLGVAQHRLAQGYGFGNWAALVHALLIAAVVFAVYPILWVIALAFSEGVVPEARALPLPTNAWHHVAFVLDGTALRLYHADLYRLVMSQSLLIGLFGFAFGVPLGLLAGVQGGRVETGIMRCADMLMAFPTLLLALLIVTALGGTLVNQILAIGVALTPNFVRLARSLALTIREQDYILAARAVGSGQLRVMARHVFPNALYALVVVATLYIATAIRTEASLSFLGLGVKPPQPDWGLMLNTLRTAMYTQPLLCALPGVMIFITSIAFNLMTDGLRSAMDIKS